MGKGGRETAQVRSEGNSIKLIVIPSKHSSDYSTRGLCGTDENPNDGPVGLRKDI